MRKLFTACLTLGFLAATGVAVFNGIIARPTNAYLDATAIAEQATATQDSATLSPTPDQTDAVLPPDEARTPAQTAAFIEAAESTLPLAESTAEATGDPLPTAIIIDPYPIPPSVINDVAVDSIITVPDVETLRQIYATGQELRRDAHAFSKLGDSTIENPHFLTRFDQPGTYNLGEWAYLQPVIDHFQGSFGRQGMAVHRGLHTWSVLDPMWADPLNCQPREDMLACEIRLHNPSVIFIRLGSNDVGIPDEVDRDMRLIVEFCIESGVIPIMGTKADRHDGSSNVNNNTIRQIAEDYHLPLWDFDLIAETLPGRGMANDGVHLTTFFSHDYTQAEAFRRGYPVHNLTALIALDQVWRAVMGL
jgi:hypothetical protein